MFQVEVSMSAVPVILIAPTPLFYEEGTTGQPQGHALLHCLNAATRCWGLHSQGVMMSEPESTFTGCVGSFLTSKKSF